MHRSRFTIARAVLAFLLTSALAVSTAPAALADATYSQNLSPGASLSTGSTVSPSDPLQMTLTAPAGGNFTLNEVTSPSQRLLGNTEYGQDYDWYGPQFNFTNNSCANGCPGQQGVQSLTVTILEDPAGFPAPPTLGPTPEWRPNPQAVCTSESMGGGILLPTFCDTSKAEMAVFCISQKGPFTVCNEDTSPSHETRPQLLPDGNVQITMQVTPISGTFDSGYAAWSCGPNSPDSIIVNSPSFDHGTLSDLLAHGVYYTDACTWASTVSGTITVTKAAARQLHLKSAVVGRISDGPGEGPIELTSAAKSAFRRRVKHFIDVRVNLQGRGTQPGQTWSDSETLHVTKPQHGSGIG